MLVPGSAESETLESDLVRIFLLAFDHAYDTDNNCKESEQLPSGTIVNFTIYKHKRAE